MKNQLVRRSIATGAALAVSAVVYAEVAGAAPPSDSLAAIRQATAKYHDPAAAVAAGYVPTDVCVTNEDGSAVMGYHYLNHELMGPGIDLRRPEALLYQPDGDGGRKLVAVEYLAFDEDSDLATDDDRPFLLDEPFDGPMEGHEPGMPVHYDLHVWVWQHNPAGMFAEYNPRGRC